MKKLKIKKTNMPLEVSVVIPIFNPNLSYLKSCLDSLLKQSYTNFEVVISDNGSDNISEIKSLLYHKYQELELELHHCKEKGIFSNLNNAIIKSKCEIIQILCQDDLLLENHIEKIFNIYSTNKKSLGMVFSQFDSVNENDYIFPLEKRYNDRLEIPNLLPSKLSQLYFLIYGCMPGNLSPVSLRRSVFSNIGYFNKNLKFAGDFDFWIRVAKSYDLYFDKKVSLLVRRHNVQASKSLSYDNLINDTTKIYKELLKELGDNKKHKIIRYLNYEIGTQYLHHYIRNFIFEGKISFKLGLLNKLPFNLYTIFIFYILSVNRKLYRVDKLSLINNYLKG